MLKNKIKYIVSDLDGTILRSTIEGISKNTIETINDFQNKTNHKLTVATGRHISMVKEYVNNLNIKLPIITCNGAMIKYFNSKEILFSFPIKKDIFKKILKKLKNDNIDCVIYTTKRIYGEINSDRVASMKKYNKNCNNGYEIDYKTSDNILDFLNIKEDILKILISVKNNDEYLLAKKYMNEYQNLTMSKSHNNMYDINNKNATKGNALLKMCEKLNLNAQNFIVYGDNENDIELFKNSGYSVAVGNALEELKKISDEVIEDIRSDSVAKHITKHFMN